MWWKSLTSLTSERLKVKGDKMRLIDWCSAAPERDTTRHKIGRNNKNIEKKEVEGKGSEGRRRLICRRCYACHQFLSIRLVHNSDKQQHWNPISRPHLNQLRISNFHQSWASSSSGNPQRSHRPAKSFEKPSKKSPRWLKIKWWWQPSSCWIVLKHQLLITE